MCFGRQINSVVFFLLSLSCVCFCTNHPAESASNSAGSRRTKSTRLISEADGDHPDPPPLPRFNFHGDATFHISPPEIWMNYSFLLECEAAFSQIMLQAAETDSPAARFRSDCPSKYKRALFWSVVLLPYYCGHCIAVRDLFISPFLNVKRWCYSFLNVYIHSYWL